MPREFFPTKRDAFQNWLPRFRERFTEHASTLGFTLAEIAAVQIDVDWLAYFSARATDTKSFRAAWVAARNSMRNGRETEPPPTPLAWNPPAPPESPVPPPGALARLRTVVARVKAHPAYEPGMGLVMEVVRSRPAPSAQPPRFSLRDTGSGGVELKFRKAGHQGVIIESKRGAETEFTRLATRTRSPWRDPRPVLTPGQPEARLYRLTFMDADEPSGPPSDMQEVVLRGAVYARMRKPEAGGAEGGNVEALRP